MEKEKLRKKKGIVLIVILLLIFFAATAVWYFNNYKLEEEEFSIHFSSEYAVVGECLKIKVTGAKKKNCDISWYVDEQPVIAENNEYIIREEDLEKNIEVRAVYGEKESKDSMYISKLPVIYISTLNGIGENYVDASLMLQKNDEFKDMDGYEGDIQIKLRGNSTKMRDKKPYKLELAQKTNLLGMGSSKDWVLLAEDIDHTLVRNRLMMYFADGLGLDYTSNATSVSLFINDNYKGVYTLIEQVRVGEDQVNITDYKELSEKLARKLVLEDAVNIGLITKEEKENAQSDKALLEQYDLLTEADKLKNDLYSNLSWLSYPYDASYKRTTYDASEYVDIPDLNGGWLLEADFYSSSSDPNSLKTAYKQPFYFNTPVEGYSNTDLYNNAKSYIQTFEYALHSDDFTFHEKEEHYKVTSGKFDYWKGWITEEAVTSYSDKKHDGYRYDDLFDMDSLINYFLVCEFSRNWDSMKNSVFIYKDVDGLAYMGPVWDFDWAFGNINMYNINTNFPEGWQTTDYYFSNEQLYQNFNWNRYLIKDEIFVNKLYEKYWEIRPDLIENIIKEDGLLENWKSQLKEAGYANDARWKYTYRNYYSNGYELSWDALETFIKKRVKWLDEQFKDVDTLYESLNSYEQYEMR